MPEKLIENLTEKPLQFPPHTCLVTNRSDGRVIDFGVDFTGIDPHVYIRESVIERVAKELLNLVPGYKLEKAERDLRRAEEEIERLQTIVDSIEAVQEAQARFEQAATTAPGFPYDQEREEVSA